MQRDLKTYTPPDLQPLVGGFLARRSQEIEGLEAALRAGDLKAVSGIAHKMKGTGVGYGFPAISEVGREMELAALAGNEIGVRELVGEYREIVAYFQSRHLI